MQNEGLGFPAGMGVFVLLPFGIAFGFIAFFVILILLKTWGRGDKGIQGERHVAKLLASLDESEYKVLNDILLRTKDGKTSQIDHIVVSVYGLFVIETKNYSGWVFGSEKAEHWTQVLYKERHSFRNPVKQNFSHIFALKDLLAEYDNVRYLPVVVFSGSAELKDIQADMPVVYDGQLLNFISSNSVNRYLDDEEVEEIVGLILGANIDGEDARKAHIESIRQAVIAQEEKKADLICPVCNGELKLREGRNGKFYGCSNYPRCRFTMPC